MKLLNRPIDNAILVYFRLVAGILMAQELINGLVIGKFHEYVDPKFHFSFHFFEWLKPWPYHGMVFHYTLTIFAAFAVAFNYHYRFFSVILWLGYTLLFLFEQTEYVNHTYLYCLMSFWMMILPLDKKRDQSPAWILYLLLFHMALAYFYGGIAKINSDWLSGTPMDLFLAARTNYPLGFIYKQSWAPLFFSYAGIAFDLFIVPLMICKHTRWFGFICSCFFHISNVMMFGLATFPWFSLLMTSMFFDPSWPRKLPFMKFFMEEETHEPLKPLRPWAVAVLSSYLIIHLSLPLRHFLYPHDTNWSEEAHMFSWRMMLRVKQGSVNFYVRNLKNQHFERVYLKNHLTQRQIEDMSGKPDLILQFAHYLKDTYSKKWNSPVSVLASSKMSLNGRPTIEMIKEGVDLAQEKRSLLPYPWINPLPKEKEKSRIARN